MKRIISLLLIIVMALTLLVSCGDPEPEPGKTPGGSTGGGEVPGEEVTDHWYDHVKFDGAEITVQLSSATDIELPCGGSMYMEGPDSEKEEGSGGGFEKVQNEVFKRNEAARETLGMTVKYEYIQQEWSHVINYIENLENSGNGMDMYCDMMYDMAGLSYRNGVFANILKYTQEDDGVSGWTEGAGYFKITGANGYNVNLMKDLALTEDKQFLIASDYYLDVLRAMFVMPFNMQLYTTYINPDDPNCEQLQETVRVGDWTWDALMAMETIYGSDAEATLESDLLLMALSVGGLSATGLIYSTAFKSYTVNANGDYILNENTGDLSEIFKKAGEVATTKGIATTPGSEQDGVAQAQAKFVSGGALFAGPSMLGVVEKPEFGEMAQLSILPVPKLGKFSDYNTAINTRARVGALGFNSTMKKETSAWIQYCSENSDNVRAEYFEKALTGKYMSNASGAGEMLEFIYKNIGDNKSMILDTMIQSKDWAVGSNYCWNQLIKGEAFTKYQNTLDSVYSAAISAKQSVLDDIMSSWATADP